MARARRCATSGLRRSNPHGSAVWSGGARCERRARRQNNRANTALKNLKVSITPYPPGVPLVYPGEWIRQVHIEFLRDGWYTDTASICVDGDF